VVPYTAPIDAVTGLGMQPAVSRGPTMTATPWLVLGPMINETSAPLNTTDEALVKATVPDNFGWLRSGNKRLGECDAAVLQRRGLDQQVRPVVSVGGHRAVAGDSATVDRDAAPRDRGERSHGHWGRVARTRR
jgi:hypothetical protein